MGLPSLRQFLVYFIWSFDMFFFLGDRLSGAWRYNFSHKRPLCTYANGLGGVFIIRF